MKKLNRLLALIALAITTNLSAQSFTMGWIPSPDKDVNNYNLYWGMMNGTNHSSTNVIATGNVTSYTVQLAVGPSYWFVLTAKSTNGTESAASDELRHTPAWPAPDRIEDFRYTTFIATRNPGTIKLDWTPVTNVVVSKQSVLWGRINTNTGDYLSTNTITLSASNQTVTITNLATYSTYWFTVTATSVNSVEGPVTDEFRYYVPALPPRGASYFRQVITISTGQ